MNYRYFILALLFSGINSASYAAQQPDFATMQKKVVETFVPTLLEHVLKGIHEEKLSANQAIQITMKAFLASALDAKKLADTELNPTVSLRVEIAFIYFNEIKKTLEQKTAEALKDYKVS